MKYKVILSNEARKELKKIKTQDKNKILIALKALEEKPYLGKKMKGIYADCYRLRVWLYRIVYKIANKRLIIFVVSEFQ
ncbi:MAG: type II toxin-antitoxin system RelE/ParE family toxin [Patescibacteria group bacterium]